VKNQENRHGHNETIHRELFPLCKPLHALNVGNCPIATVTPIKRLKQYAFDHEREISEVVADAVEQFIEGQPMEVALPARVVALEMEVHRLTERLDIEEQFRTDTEVRHFKKWLRSHDQP
jgi:hypothetical protein